MNRPKYVSMVLVVGLLAFNAVESAPERAPGAQAGGPWTAVLYMADGQLESARGYSREGFPLELTAETRHDGARLLHTLIYTRGSESLRIDRVYDPMRGLTVTYQTDTERWTLALLPDSATGELLALYTLDNGRIYSLWLDARGQIASGDPEGLRRALRVPSRLAGLIQHYVSDRQALVGSVPVSGDEAMMFLPLKGCADTCSMGCGEQCALECYLLGVVGCRVCQASCALGCLIGCS